MLRRTELLPGKSWQFYGSGSKWLEEGTHVWFISERCFEEFFHSRTNKYDRIFDLIQKAKFSHSPKDQKKWYFWLQNVGSKHDKSLNKVVYGKVNISIYALSQNKGGKLGEAS